MNRLSAHFLFIPRYTAGSVEYGSLQLSDLNILGTLGVGAFGKVYLVSWLNVLSVEVTMNWADSSNLTGIRLRGEGNFFNLNQKVDKLCCLFCQIEEYTELCQHQYCTLNVRFYLVWVYKSANWFKWSVVLTGYPRAFTFWTRHCRLQLCVLELLTSTYFPLIDELSAIPIYFNYLETNCTKLSRVKC